MKSIERFFRRYILSTIGILILFFLLNILLLGAYFVIAGLGNVKNSNFPIEELSRHIEADSSTLMRRRRKYWRILAHGL